MDKKFTASFSRLQTFKQCRYQYYLNYILPHIVRDAIAVAANTISKTDNAPDGLIDTILERLDTAINDVCPKNLDNAFNLYGSFVHELMERYAKGELDAYELTDIYDDEFDKRVTVEFPFGLRDGYQQSGHDFLANFNGFIDDNGEKFKVLGIEEKFVIQIGDFDFTGFIDLVLEDTNGRLIIRDWKSKGKIKSKKELAEMGRQLYLYSRYIKEKYDRYPDELQFYLFRKDKIERIKFDIKAYNEAEAWANGVVGEILCCTDWSPTVDSFFCAQLCGFGKEFCKYAQEEMRDDVS